MSTFKPCIMLIEDDDGTRTFWQSALETAGYKVLALRDHMDAKDYLEEHGGSFVMPDGDVISLVMTDNTTLGSGSPMNGLAFAQEHKGKLPIILITAEADSALSAKNNKLAVAAAVKPLSIKQVVALADSVLNPERVQGGPKLQVATTGAAVTSPARGAGTEVS